MRAFLDIITIVMIAVFLYVCSPSISTSVSAQGEEPQDQVQETDRDSMWEGFTPGSIAASLIATAIGAVAGYLLRLGVEYRESQKRNKSIMNFFRIDFPTKRKIYIVHPAVPRPNPNPFFFIPSCDMKVVRDVGTLLEQLGLKELIDFEILNAHEVDHRQRHGLIDIWEHDLVLVGGTKANPFVREVLPSLNGIKRLKYHLGYDAVNDITTMHVVATNTPLIPSKDNPAEQSAPEQYDYGLIQSVISPVSSGCNIVLLAGIHGAGTLGLGDIITNELLDMCPKRVDDPIEQLVKVKYLANDPHHITGAERITG